MRFTYEMKLVRSEKGSRYDMIKVRFPGSHKQFGECRHGINGAVCDSCKLTGRLNWIDREKLTTLPSCRWCGELIGVFSPTPFNELRITPNRIITRVAGPDLTHGGQRGVWYLRMPLHFGCMMDGEPSFHTYGEERGSLAVNRGTEELNGTKEADRAYYPEVADLLGAPDEDEFMPFNDERWTLIIEAERETQRAARLSGPVAHSVLIPKIKCGQCKNKHQTAYQVKRCYENASLLKEKEGK